MKKQAEHLNIYICLFKLIGNWKKKSRFKSSLEYAWQQLGYSCKILMRSFLILQIALQTCIYDIVFNANFKLFV